VGVGLSITSRAQAVPQIRIVQAVGISNLFIGRSSIVLVQQLSGYLDVAVSMRRWLKNRCGLTGLEARLCRIGPVPWPCRRLRAICELRAPCNALPEALDPLGQRLRTPAQRRVRRRFVSAHRLLAGYDAFGQGVLGKVHAQARHSAGEGARVYADERALLCQVSCSSRLFTRSSFSASPPGRESRAARPYRYHSLKVPGVLDRLSLPYTALHWS
jgi:hypothetical protein